MEQREMFAHVEILTVVAPELVKFLSSTSAPGVIRTASEQRFAGFALCRSNHPV
jgi:hypothetical protein